MATVRRFLSIALLALPLLLLQSCDENITGPGPGSGNLFEATIDGEKLTIPLAVIGNAVPRYDTVAQQVSFGGTAFGPPNKTVTVFFTFDIDTASVPGSGTQVNIVYIVTSGSTDEIYRCDLVNNNCTVTVTARNGDIIDGTFQGTLVNSSDSTKKITITNGRFSVKVTRA
jgi:hypothetical protein